MGHGLQRHEDIGLGVFALIELANLRFIAHRKVGGFDKRPGQVRIAILRVPLPLPLPLPIAQIGAADAPAVGGNLADGGESANLAGLQHNRESQGAANAGNGQQ